MMRLLRSNILWLGNVVQTLELREKLKPLHDPVADFGLPAAAELDSTGVAFIDTSTGGGVVADAGERLPQEVAAEVKKCQQQWGATPPAKVDLVITWWTDRAQSSQRLANGTTSVHGTTSRSSASALVQDHAIIPDDASTDIDANPSDNGNALTTTLQTDFENQSEIRYLLRSYQKHGLLSSIANIYILVDHEVLQKFGAPRGLIYETQISGTDHRLRLVSDNTTHSDNEKAPWTRYNKRIAGVHRIPGLSPFFLLTPDDAFATTQDVLTPKDFAAVFFEQVKNVFGAAGEKERSAPSTLEKRSSSTSFRAASPASEQSSSFRPILYTFGTVQLGDCLGHGPVGSGHGPVMVSTCVLGALDKGLFQKRPARSPHGYEAVCVYQHAMHEVLQADLPPTICFLVAMSHHVCGFYKDSSCRVMLVAMWEGGTGGTSYCSPASTTSGGTEIVEAGEQYDEDVRGMASPWWVVDVEGSFFLELADTTNLFSLSHAHGTVRREHRRPACVFFGVPHKRSERRLQWSGKRGQQNIVHQHPRKRDFGRVRQPSIKNLGAVVQEALSRAIGL